MPTRGPRAMRKSRGRSGASIVSALVSRSAPLSARPIASARVTLPGPLVSRDDVGGTPRRRAIARKPVTGSSARINTQPGRPAGWVIAFRQWCRPYAA